MALEHRFIETNGVRLHCAVAGAGPLVIFLHGFPECWYSWRHQLEALAPYFRVVAPDLRGYGDSDKPAGIAAYTMPHLIADIEGLIQALGEHQTILVGHDWGGGLAWYFATERPTLTRQLVVMNCPHPAIFQQHLMTNRQQLRQSWYLFFFQIPWLPETLLGLNHAWLIGKAIRQSAVQKSAITEADIAYLRDAASKPGALHSGINYYRAVFRSPESLANLPDGVWRFVYGREPRPPARRTLEDWPQISAPTLVIWGEQDIALDKALTLGMEPLFKAPFRVQYVPDSGHWVQQEKAQLVNDALLEFLAR